MQSGMRRKTNRAMISMDLPASPSPRCTPHRYRFLFLLYRDQYTHLFQFFGQPWPLFAGILVFENRVIQCNRAAFRQADNSQRRLAIRAPDEHNGFEGHLSALCEPSLDFPPHIARHFSRAYPFQNLDDVLRGHARRTGGEDRFLRDLKQRAHLSAAPFGKTADLGFRARRFSQKSHLEVWLRDHLGIRGGRELPLLRLAEKITPRRGDRKRETLLPLAQTNT